MVLDILVVDDASASRRAMEVAIRTLGHRCRLATDGREACRLLAERPADVVLSDWEMPHMNGAELCRRIRSGERRGANTSCGGDNEGHYTYFILMSGFHDRDHLLAGMAAGADDYQRKPIDLDELEARLVSAARVIKLHRRLADREKKLQRDSSQFRAASRTDALTGAGNRLRLDEELASSWSRAERYGHRFSLALLDVDYFKGYNDRFGHLAGDDALRSVVAATKSVLRTSDSVSRYGGEEFVILLPEQSLPDGVKAAERVREQVMAERIHGDDPDGAPLTVSIGVAELDLARDTSVQDWLARADAALYLAKSKGRNRVEPLSTSPLVKSAG